MKRIEFFKKTNSKMNLILGFIWLGLGIITFFIDSDKTTLFNYFPFPLGILYLFLFFSEKRPYFIIEKNEIIKTTFPKRKFNLENLQRINRNSYGYNLISNTQNDFKITTSIIKTEDLQKLNLILKTYETKT